MQVILTLKSESPKSHVILVITAVGVEAALVKGAAEDLTPGSQIILEVITPVEVTNREDISVAANANVASIHLDLDLFDRIELSSGGEETLKSVGDNLGLSLRVGRAIRETISVVSAASVVLAASVSAVSVLVASAVLAASVVLASAVLAASVVLIASAVLAASVINAASAVIAAGLDTNAVGTIDAIGTIDAFGTFDAGDVIGNIDTVALEGNGRVCAVGPNRGGAAGNSLGPNRG